MAAITVTLDFETSPKNDLMSITKFQLVLTSNSGKKLKLERAIDKAPSQIPMLSFFLPRAPPNPTPEAGTRRQSEIKAVFSEKNYVPKPQ